MTCTVSKGAAFLPCPRAMATALAMALTLLAVPQGMAEAKGWLAGTLHVEASDYRWGQLVSLKGAVENGDPFRATRIMVEAGQRPDPLIWQPALKAITAPTFIGV